MNNKLTLSEAIRLGSMLKPQGFALERSTATSCVKDAACEAIGKTHSFIGADRENFVDETLVAAFPIFSATNVCPVETCVCHNNAYSMWQLLPHLNDIHRWSRERIADWVESIERRAAEAERIASEMEPEIQRDIATMLERAAK